MSSDAQIYELPGELYIHISQSSSCFTAVVYLKLFHLGEQQIIGLIITSMSVNLASARVRQSKEKSSQVKRNSVSTTLHSPTHPIRGWCVAVSVDKHCRIRVDIAYSRSPRQPWMPCPKRGISKRNKPKYPHYNAE